LQYELIINVVFALRDKFDGIDLKMNMRLFELNEKYEKLYVDLRGKFVKIYVWCDGEDRLKNVL